MNILYIHGLNSFPHPERLEILKAKGHQTFALHLDYEKEPQTFEILKNYATANFGKPFLQVRSVLNAAQNVLEKFFFF